MTDRNKSSYPKNRSSVSSGGPGLDCQSTRCAARAASAAPRSAGRVRRHGLSPMRGACMNLKPGTASPGSFWLRPTRTFTPEYDLRGKAPAPQTKRTGAAVMIAQCPLGEPRARWLVGALPSAIAIRQRPTRQPRTCQSSLDIAPARWRFGFQHIHDLLRAGFPQRVPQQGLPALQRRAHAASPVRRAAAPAPWRCNSISGATR